MNVSVSVFVWPIAPAKTEYQRKKNEKKEKKQLIPKERKDEITKSNKINKCSMHKLVWCARLHEKKNNPQTEYSSSLLLTTTATNLYGTHRAKRNRHSS